MRPSDLDSIHQPVEPTLDPSGRYVVYSVVRPDPEANRYRSALWRLDVRGKSEPVQLSQGEGDRAPAYSPDGRWIAFTRSVSGGPAQLWVLPADGGEARCLTDAPLGVGAPRWSPDSSRIAYTARIPEPGRYGTDPTVAADQEAPRLIRHRTYLNDGLGYVLDRPQKVFVVDVTTPTPQPAQVTAGAGDDDGPVWLVEKDRSERIGFIAHRTASGRWRPDTLISDVCSVRPDGKKFTRHTDGSGSVAALVVDPAGREAYYLWTSLGRSEQDFVGRYHHWYRLGEDTPLTEPGDGRALPIASVGDVGLVAAFDHRGDVIARVVGSGVPVLDGVAVTGVATAGGTIALTAGTPSSYGEVFAGGRRSVRVRTDYATSLPGDAVRLAKELVATVPGGGDVHGWVVRPDGRGPHPVILMVHGGPFAQYTAHLFDEAQVLAGAGYAVVMCNPRGSSGYGPDHGRAVRGAIGVVDVTDILAFLDEALTAADLDESRVGVMGGSYGGLMTTWLLAHSDRFVAGISERAVNAWDSFTGTSDIGWYFAQEYVGDQALEQSPLTHADRITDPLLIIHSERDFRCPLEQAQRLYERLMRRGVTTELLIFPGEGHELSRTGQPRHRVQRFEHILRWWSTHLPV